MRVAGKLLMAAWLLSLSRSKFSMGTVLFPSQSPGVHERSQW